MTIAPLWRTPARAAAKGAANMSTIAQEIPRDKWLDYFNEIGRVYSGWGVSAEVLAGELGDQHTADGLPLQGLSYEKAGSQAGDILVETGDKNMPFETHLIHRPRAVRVVPSRPGAELDIEIDDEEGFTHLVEVKARPELPPPSQQRQQQRQQPGQQPRRPKKA